MVTSLHEVTWGMVSVAMMQQVYQILLVNAIGAIRGPAPLEWRRQKNH